MENMSKGMKIMVAIINISTTIMCAAGAAITAVWTVTSIGELIGDYRRKKAVANENKIEEK